MGIGLAEMQKSFCHVPPQRGHRKWASPADRLHQPGQAQGREGGQATASEPQVLSMFPGCKWAVDLSRV